MENRTPKGPTQEFTTITTSEGTYELWNSLTEEQEQQVIDELGLKKYKLPLSKKDAKRQRLLFGVGSFGKVRLARKNGKFYAVKKIAIKPGEEEALSKENNFGQFLEAAGIPNVSYGVDGAPSTNARGQKIYYLFMPKVGSLGDGINVKRLINYLPEEQRAVLLRHAAGSLLEALVKMHAHQMYHRDIKASNLLASAAGEVFFSDFGAAKTDNSELIKNVTGENNLDYTVSNRSDMRYFPPELCKLMLLKNVKSAFFSDELLDNWRLGLTILQLCGVIKENEGLLSRMYDVVDKETGKFYRGWVNELRARKQKDLSEIDIRQRFEDEINKIKTEGIHKIPVELQHLTLSLLELDPNKRMTAAQALGELSKLPPLDHTVLDEGFENLAYSQIAVKVKRGIKKALLLEASKINNEEEREQWLNQVLLKYRTLLKNPSINATAMQDFVEHFISEQNRPSFTLEHYEVALELINKNSYAWEKIQRKQSAAAKGESNLSHYVDIPVKKLSQAPQEVSDSPYDFIPTPLDNENNEQPLNEPLTPPISDDYVSVDKLLHDIKATEESKKPVYQPPPEEKKVESPAWKAAKPHTVSAPPPVSPVHIDPELNRLENAIKGALNELSAYIKTKTKDNQSLFNELDGIVNSMKSSFTRIKNRLFGKPIEITRVEAAKGPIDESALKAVFARTEQIVSQLTLGKLMQLSQAEADGVSRMLMKDKQFLEGITPQIADPSRIRDILQKINGKLDLLDKINHDQHLHTSGQTLDSHHYVQQNIAAKTYLAKNAETKTQFTFTESPEKSSYKLPSPFTDAVRSFIATRALNEHIKAGKVHIYTTKPAIGKSVAQAIFQLAKNHKELQIYVNDELIPRPSGKLFKFFTEDTAPHMMQQSSKFTVEEITGQAISLDKK